MQMLEAAAARVAAPATQGPIIVSCLATFMMRWLIPKLYAFSSAHPHIEVRLSASHAPARFAEDGIDVAIRIGKPPWPRRVAAHRLFPDRIGPVLAPALQRRHRLTHPGDLRKTVRLHTQTRAEAWADWLRIVGLDTMEAADGPRFEHTYFLLEAAASGLGVAIGSYPLVKEDLDKGRLVAPFGFMPSPAAYYLLHPKNNPNSAKIAAFSAWIVAQARSDGFASSND